MSTTAGKRGKRKAPANEGKTTKVAVKKPRKPKGMPDFKPGETLVDLVKKQWRLGDLIGWGGFGALYYASPDTDKAVNDKATYVAKVEPHSNGPLFGELAFYQRVAKEETINKWVSSHKLKFLGVPAYVGSGGHENGGSKYRFMIMERFADDVDQIFAKCGKRFHIQTVLTLGIRIIDILEYIHAQGYVHADIKGSNLMMGYKTNRKDKVFLVDYGLAYRFNADGAHKEYKEDPKRRHDGTIEFTSCDAHKGVAPSRRTDLEILGYVMLQWLCSKLPWEDNLADKDYVMNSKIRLMENIPQSLKKCLKDQRAVSDELEQYFKYIATLKYVEIPDYNKLRKIFQDGLRKRKFTDDGQTVKFKTADGASSSNDDAMEDCLNDSEESEGKASSLKPSRRNPVSRKPESQCSTKEPASPAKPSTSNKRAASPIKPSTSNKRAANSPRKPAKPRAGTSKSKAVQQLAEETDPQESSSDKRVAKGRARKTVQEKSENDEMPARRGRGRPKKTTVPVFVDRGTSP